MPIIAIIPNIPIIQKLLFFSKKKHADYCVYSEYSVLKPNIRPSIPIIQKLFFFLRKNMPIIAIIPNIRFLNRIFGGVFRLFKNYFFSNKKIADYCDYSEYSVSKPNIRRSIPIIQKFFFFLSIERPSGLDSLESVSLCSLLTVNIWKKKKKIHKKKHADYCDYSEYSDYSKIIIFF